MEKELITEFIEHLRQKGRHPDTLAEYRANISEYSEHLAQSERFSFFAADEPAIIAYYRAVKEKHLSPKTAWKKQHAVHAFYAWLRDSGRLLINPAPLPVLGRRAALPKSIPSWPTLRHAYRRLRESRRPWHQRDFAMIDLAYSCGLRRGELTALDVTDINADTQTIRVRGKGGRERIVPIGKRTLADLLHYVYRTRPYFLKESRTKALFVSWFDSGKRLNPRSINKALRDLHGRYGLDRCVTPHNLRHAFATDLIKSGAPVQDVSKMLGHVKLETTQIYTRLYPHNLKQHHAKYHPRG
jgi:integrase/recombinase XerD